ncbi:uncharacterized protein LOC128173383 isoform X2 [Crassostrea angulata]|nr:uncharacterized protein LOC128173383 isoform X2 [Crassostrea angulata]
MEDQRVENMEIGEHSYSCEKKNYEDEYSLLRERRFVFGEGALIGLIKRTTCEQCGEPIDPSTVLEGEKIPAGVKYKFLCCNGYPGKWISTPFYGGSSFIVFYYNSWCFLQKKNYEDEFALLIERRFVVGLGAFIGLIKRTTCEQCGKPIDPSTVLEGEKIPAGVKYKFLLL